MADSPSYPASHTDDCFQPTVVFRPDRRSYWNFSRSIVSSSVDELPHFSSRRSRFTSTRERQSFSEAYSSRPDRDLDIGVHSASFIHGSCTPHSSFWLLTADWSTEVFTACDWLLLTFPVRSRVKTRFCWFWSKRASVCITCVQARVQA